MDFMESDVHQRYISTASGFVIETWQDVSAYLRNNERMYTENQVNKHAASWRKDAALGWQMASIPLVLIHKLMKKFQKERGLPQPPRYNDPEFKTYLFATVRDPAWRKLRVDGRTD